MPIREIVKQADHDVAVAIDISFYLQIEVEACRKKVIFTDVFVVMAFRVRSNKWRFANSTRRGLFVCISFEFFRGVLWDTERT